MSPRRRDPQIRANLVETAARLLASEGPQTLSTRRLAAETGTSTMAVYTYFGGMGELVRAMAYEGFSRLHGYLMAVGQTDDPVADLTRIGWAYRHNALTNPHLYAVMLGGSALGGFQLSDEDRQHGRYTMVTVVDCVARCMRAGRFDDGDAALVAHKMWSATHGLVTLELGGYLIDPYPADVCLEAQLVGLMVGAGDSLEAATESVRRAGRTVNPPVAPEDGTAPTRRPAATAAGRRTSRAR